MPNDEAVSGNSSRQENTILNKESQQLSPKVTYSNSRDSFPSAIPDTDSGRPENQCVSRITRNKNRNSQKCEE